MASPVYLSCQTLALRSLHDAGDGLVLHLVALQQAREALPTLLQKIETYADPDTEGTEALAAFLLAPYSEMVVDIEMRRRATRPKPSEPTPRSGSAYPDTP